MLRTQIYTLRRRLEIENEGEKVLRVIAQRQTSFIELRILYIVPE